MSGFADTNTEGPASLGINGGVLGTELSQLLLQDDLIPGAEASYQVCKTILIYHPLGRKMAFTPVKMAMSQAREITVPGAPDEAADAFNAQWKALGLDRAIQNAAGLARVYGVATLVYGSPDSPTNEPIPSEKLPDLPLYFHVFDPLNTSGSLVLNQDPNAPDFQKPVTVSVGGKNYHPSRTCVVMNEDPIYIAFSTSAFGYVGRSVYQRALFPMKSFVQSMLTDDMVTQKAGVLIAKIKQAGSIADRIMTAATGLKRTLLKGARTYNVLSISPDEAIESLNLQNIDGAVKMARDNILKNIATAADMPAQLLNNETMVEGFGEGTEDAKNIAHYIDGVRIELGPIYDFLDPLVMARAWGPEFYLAMQAKHPDEYGEMDYDTAFYKWKNAFKANWPSLLSEPESEAIKTEDVKLKALIAMLEVLMPQLDPDNKATLIAWAADNINEAEKLFTSPLVLDYLALRAYVPPTQGLEEGAGKEPAPPLPFRSAA